MTEHEDTPYRFVYVTAPNRDVALALGRAAVKERLAACANVLSELTSIYVWNDALNEDPEVGLILKTRQGRVPELIAKIKALHPYECPCIIVLPIVGGYAPYLDWIGKETM